MTYTHKWIIKSFMSNNKNIYKKIWSNLITRESISRDFNDIKTLPYFLLCRFWAVVEN